MLKRPGLVFFRFPTLAALPPAPQGAGPHTSLGVSKREEIITLSSRKPGRGILREVWGSGGASQGRARGWPALAGCAAPGSAAARARALIRGGEVRGLVRGRALWEWSRGGGRGGQGRGRGGARTPRRAGLLRGCSAATSRRPLVAVPRA